MRKEIYCYCSFDTQGNIIPLQFQIEENGELHTIKVLRYKPPKIMNKSEQYYSGARTSPYLLDYHCVVEIGGVEKIVVLSYVIAEHKWVVVL